MPRSQRGVSSAAATLAAASMLAAAVSPFGCSVPENREIDFTDVDFPESAVVIRSDRGSELGVSTEHGILFLGRSARDREAVEVTFSAGPNSFTYPGTVVSEGGPVALVDTAFRTREVPVASSSIRPGEPARVSGITAGRYWWRDVSSELEPVFQGNLVEVEEDAYPPTLVDLAGAGVYVRRGAQWQLAGLVTETIEWRGPTEKALLSGGTVEPLGAQRILLLYAGPSEIARGSILPRKYFERQEKVYDPRMIR